MFAQSEGATDEVAVRPSFWDDRVRREQFHEILVEGAEQVEREISRLRSREGFQEQPQAGGPRKDVGEGLLIERIVQDDAARQDGGGRPEDRGHPPIRSPDSRVSPGPRTGPSPRG